MYMKKSTVSLKIQNDISFYEDRYRDIRIDIRIVLWVQLRLRKRCTEFLTPICINTTLFEKGFCRCNQVRWGWDLNPITGVFIKRGNLETQRHRKAIQVITKSEIRFATSQGIPRIVNIHHKLEEGKGRGFFFRVF